MPGSERHSNYMFRVDESIERKLPLLVTGLLLTVVAALSVAASNEVRREARLLAAERLERIARELGALFDRSPAQRASETAALAGDPGIRAFARTGGKGARAAAEAAARRLVATTPQGVAVELWDTLGRRLLRVGDSTLPAFRPGAPPDSTTVSPIHAIDSLLYYTVAAAVVVDDHPVGTAVQLRRVSQSAQSRQTIAALIGGDASLLYGNASGAPWTDGGQIISPPPAIARLPDELRAYERDGESRLGWSARIGGTPWLFLIEFPRRQVYAPARAYLGRMAVIAALIVLAGALGARAVSRSITRPLRGLTAAAEAIAGGDMSQRVDVGGRDEMGRLAAAFNSMADQVARARERLETQVAERTAALAGANRTLARLGAIVETSEDAIYSKALDGTILTWNPAAERLYGYTAQEAVGCPVSLIVPEEQGAEVPALLTRLERGDRITHYETVRVRKDGRRVHVSLTLSPIRDEAGRVVGASSIARDISDRKRTEEALHSSEERFRAVTETANDAIISADRQGHIMYFNPAAERTFGYTAAEVLNRPLTLLMPERLRAAHLEGFQRYLATGKPRVVGSTVELVGRRKDGSEFPLELSLGAWRIGNVPSFTGIVRDISDRKRAEELRTAHANALDRFNTELRAVNQELESFSYSVSHDLRAPLRAIDGFSRILLEDHAAALPADARRLLDVIRTNTKRMGALIDDLLAFSRLGRKELTVVAVDMAALVRDVADELRRERADRALEITVGPLPTALGDPSLLRQVVANLLQNAVKFTRGRPAAHIEVGARPDGDRHVYYVADNGVGFDMQYADKLFGVFQRLHRTEEFEGTGVGLAIVQRIVHRHGGRVWAEAAPDHGATFYFTLPAEANTP